MAGTTHKTYTPGVVYYPEMISTSDVASSPLTVTSAGQLTAGAKSVMLTLTAADDGEDTFNNRSGVFTVEISADGGTVWNAYNMLIKNIANDAGDTVAGEEIGLTRVASITRAATGTDIIWMTPETLGAITNIRAKLVITNSTSPKGLFTVRANVAY